MTPRAVRQRWRRKIMLEIMSGSSGTQGKPEKYTL